MSHHVRVHVDLQVGAAQVAVPVVGDVTTVHNLAEQVSQVLPGYLENSKDSWNRNTVE